MKIKYKLYNGSEIEIEVNEAVAACLGKSEEEEKHHIKHIKKNCISLELLKNRERRVLQTGQCQRSRDKPYGGELHYDRRGDPQVVLEQREALEKLNMLREDRDGQ